jgi:DHA2 family multidrug resistance protein
MAAAALTATHPLPVPADADRIDPARLVAFLAMCFGMFMAFLDIQVVSASLAEIQAGLAASSDEITWVQTSYLMAEVVAIPLSGFLSRALGTRMMFATAAAGFTFASLMCGLTSSMNEMIVWRAIQGFIGGGMVPTVFASAYIIFPRSRMVIITPLIGLVATLAPTIGPTVGGYLTDALSWHWLFFINIVPGIIVTVAALTLIDFDRPDFKLFETFDWIGLAFMALFLGALEYVLEDGPRYDWFDDSTIALMGVISAASAAIFFFRVLTARNPIVDLHAFLDRNFAVGSIFSFVLGIGLYGLTYLYPVYLGEIRGYDALMIGKVMFVSGASMFLTAPVVGRLAAKFDPRIMLAAGFLIFALSNWQLTSITTDWDFAQVFLPQVLRGIGLMFAIVPITNLALGTLPPERLKNARTRGAQYRARQSRGPALRPTARRHHLVAAIGDGKLAGDDRADAGLGCAKHGAQAAVHDGASARHCDGFCRRVPAARAVVRGFRAARRRDAPARRGSRRLRRALSPRYKPQGFYTPCPHCDILLGRVAGGTCRRSVKSKGSERAPRRAAYASKLSFYRGRRTDGVRRACGAVCAAATRLMTREACHADQCRTVAHPHRTAHNRTGWLLHDAIGRQGRTAGRALETNGGRIKRGPPLPRRASHRSTPRH